MTPRLLIGFPKLLQELLQHHLLRHGAGATVQLLAVRGHGGHTLHHYGHQDVESAKIQPESVGHHKVGSQDEQKRFKTTFKDEIKSSRIFFQNLNQAACSVYEIHVCKNETNKPSEAIWTMQVRKRMVWRCMKSMLVLPADVHQVYQVYQVTGWHWRSGWKNRRATSRRGVWPPWSSHPGSQPARCWASSGPRSLGFVISVSKCCVAVNRAYSSERWTRLKTGKLMFFWCRTLQFFEWTKTFLRRNLQFKVWTTNDMFIQKHPKIMA